MCAVRATLHNASLTLNTCAHRAVLAHLGQPEVHQLRLAVKQHDGVRMARRTENLLRWRDLYKATEVHHANGRRHMAHYGKVVANKEVGQAQSVL